MHDISHHHHNHHATSVSEREKLQKRIAHWKHHNEDHLQSYREWQGTAEKMGYHRVAEMLQEICEKAEEQNVLFQKILEML